MNTAFSQTRPTLQFAWDSTSMSAFKECPRKYYYSIILGYTTKQPSFHLEFGIWYHEALELYDRILAKGGTHDEATRSAVLKTLKSTWNKSLKRPWSSGDSNKNRFTLIRTIVWYLEQFKNDPIKTIRLADGTPAVELSFRYPFPHEFTTGERAVFCGHLDRMGDIGGASWIIDRKTSKHEVRDDHYWRQYSPDNQMSAYSFAGRVVYNIPVRGVIIDAAQVMVTFSRFQRGFANRTESQLDEWAADTQSYMEQADKYSRDNYWPMNDKSCFNYGGCPFRPICARAPEVREKFLELEYNKRIWDPLQIRGDV